MRDNIPCCKCGGFSKKIEQLKALSKTQEKYIQQQAKKLDEAKTLQIQLQAELAEVKKDRDAHSKVRQQHLVKHGKACDKIEQLQAENEKSKRALRKAKALMEWADTPLNIKDFSLEWCITESMIKQSLKERS